jgi:trigger factor
MDIIEVSSDGLKREFKVSVGHADIAARKAAKLAELAKQMKIPGFRPGKVPMNVVEQRYGSSVLGEVLEKTVQETSQAMMSEKGLRPALQPQIEVSSFEENKGIEYTMKFEVLPEVKPVALSSIKLEKPVFSVADTEVQEALERLTTRFKSSEPLKEKRGAKMGDIAVIDFKGTVDGEARPGMDGTDFELELGSKSFIDNFEEQLTGTKAGDHRSVKVTFPANYGAQELAGREAVFEVDIKELKKPVPAKLDDELAKKMGVESLDKLREMVRSQLQADYDGYTRLKLKRSLLDSLAEKHSFPVPVGMVDIEFETIWKRVEEEMQGEQAAEKPAAEGKKKPAAKGKKAKAETDPKQEYREIAERRVRLGLLLNEIGRSQNLQVTKEELNRALALEARNYPGQEKQVFDFYRQHPHALENLRAPLYEDKVVDYVLTQVKLSDKAVTREELTASDDDDDNASQAA